MRSSTEEVLPLQTHSEPVPAKRWQHALWALLGYGAVAFALCLMIGGIWKANKPELNERACPYTGPAAGEAHSGCPFAGLGPPETQMSVPPTHLSVSPDPGQMTAKGCECDSSCGASIDDGYRCDWCRTKHDCGEWSAFGHFDYCVYPDTPSFEKLGFEDKDKYFERQLTKDKTRAKEYASPTVILSESSQTSFWDYQDELPAGRVKGIHSIGAVCSFEIDIAQDSPYTGLLAGGSQRGWIRMGGATTWDKSSKGYPPGLGIKFSRSGIHSGSYVALVSLDVATWNFMAYNFSNHIAPAASFATKLLVKKFQQAGAKVDAPRFPFKLFLVPTQAVQRPNVPKSIDDVMGDLESFKPGTALFTVYACGKGLGASEMDPTAGGVEAGCGDPFKLGEMVSTSECSTSAYGDKKFFIRHQPIEQDWQLRPELLSQYDAKAACGWSKDPTPSGIPKVCPGSGN